MANQYEAYKKTIGDMLALTNPQLIVPTWQRNYSWDSDAIEAYWHDLLSFSNHYPGDLIQKQEYFLGSIVVVIGGQEHLVLDGQQRLATSTILLSVIRDFIKTHSPEVAVKTAERWIVTKDDATGEYAHKLKMNNYDREFFRQEIQTDRTASYVPPAVTQPSHSLIRAARKFFAAKFSERYQELNNAKDAFEWSLRIRRVLVDHFSVVMVTSTDEDNAATVFETLNDRGIGLSTTDLLRSLLLRRAADSERESIVACWQTIFEMDDESDVASFLRHHWLSIKGDVKTRSLYREIKSEIEQMDHDSLKFSQTLQSSAITYKDILAAKDEDEDVRHLLEDIHNLSAKSLYPAILSSYRFEDKKVERKDLIRALIVFYVRHQLICSLEGSQLENVIYSVAAKLNESGDFPLAIARIKEATPLDPQFVSAFETAIVNKRNAVRYLLREIEHEMRSTSETTVGEPNKVHVEHIYPQVPQERWTNHAQMVSRLGNMTLLAASLNEAARNGEFKKKKALYEKSDLLITKELLAYADWTPEMIAARQKKWIPLAIKIWPR